MKSIFVVTLAVVFLAVSTGLGAGEQAEFFIPLVFGSATEGTGLAFSNFGGSPAALTLEFFAPNGSLLAGPIVWDQTTATTNRKLLPGEQRALTHAEVFSLPADQPVAGWVRVLSDSRDVRVVYQHFTASLDRLDGMNAVERPARQLFLPLVLTRTGTANGAEGAVQTRIAIVNPTDSSLSFSISSYRADGTRALETQKTLGARAMLESSGAEFLPGADSTGAVMIEVNPDSPGAGLVACQASTFAGTETVAYIVSNAFEANGYDGPLYSAQAARAGSLETNVRLFNTGAAPLTASLSLIGDDGDMKAGPKETAIPPRGFANLNLSQFLELVDGTIGSLRVTPSGAGIIGSVWFNDPKGYCAALPLQQPSSGELVFPHVAYLKPGPGRAGMFTGLAIHSTGESNVDGTIEVFNKEGNRTGSSPFNLPPRGRIARQVSELVTLAEQAGGSVRIRSTGNPLVAQELFGDYALRMLSAVPAFDGTGYDPLAVPTTKFIVVDQFGYLPEAQKIAVIRDPVTGYDAADSFTPGNNYVLVNADSGRQVFSGAPAAWNGGLEDASSGDRAWWFDFSGVAASGDYYILDVQQNVRSAVFRISDEVYRDVLRHAVRTFFYQRAGFAKEANFAGDGWADGASHIGPLQDKNCRVYNRPADATSERDLSGGWYDAGDYNKYTNWTAEYVIELLRAYEETASVFTDDFNIPESGNGVPDILDETKWGMDWLVRMQNQDGSVLSIVGLSHASPPSAASGPSEYGLANTSATLTTAAAFAYGAKVYGAFPGGRFQAYASDLLQRAERAWQWAVVNPSVIFRNNDGASGTSGLGAGQQETDGYGRLVKKIEAAVYLFEMTGKSEYRDFVDANRENVNMIAWGYVFPFQARIQETLLYYAALPGATAASVDRIRSVYRQAVTTGSDNLPAIRDNRDPYLAHIKDYTWGSNGIKCRQGAIFAHLADYGVAPELATEAESAAARYIHYIHGVNPLGIVYLSNMYGAGAESSVNEFYHSWFSNGSVRWDRVGVSTFGPAPGFLTGGPNPSYNWDGCCPSGCGSTANNAICNSEPINPPKGQPKQKSYKDFNTSWPLNSWSVTENSCGYQVAYIRLLARFVR